MQEYNNNLHTIINLLSIYLFVGQFPYISPHNQEIYPPVKNALKIEKERTTTFQQKNKLSYNKQNAESHYNIGYMST